RSQGLAPGQIEHWVIDSGSTDGTVALLEKQPDIKYVSEKDRGLSDAVNKGVRRANGQWIIWLNADDELAPGALARFQETIKNYPGTCIFCGAQKVMGYDGSLESITQPWDYNL